MSQRRADPAGDGLGGGHRRNHPDPHPRPLLGFLQNGGGHREYPWVAGGHHRHRPALIGQRAGQPRPGGFVGVVAGMAPLAVADFDPVQVAAIADQIRRGGQLTPALRCHPVAVAGPQAHHCDGAGQQRTTPPARQHGQREVRHAGLVDVGGRQYPLAGGAGPLHVERVAE